jgi:hypothetical protein
MSSDRSVAMHGSRDSDGFHTAGVSIVKSRGHLEEVASDVDQAGGFSMGSGFTRQASGGLWLGCFGAAGLLPPGTLGSGHPV